jgi:hypothetical protein
MRTWGRISSEKKNVQSFVRLALGGASYNYKTLDLLQEINKIF